MEGGGGLVGSINTAGMTNAIREGYASASTDTGHTGSSGRFALGHPDKITDFAYRAKTPATATLTVASETYLITLDAFVRALNFDKGNEKIMDLMNLARLLPFTDSAEEAAALQASYSVHAQLTARWEAACRCPILESQTYSQLPSSDAPVVQWSSVPVRRKLALSDAPVFLPIILRALKSRLARKTSNLLARLAAHFQGSGEKRRHSYKIGQE